MSGEVCGHQFDDGSYCNQPRGHKAPRRQLWFCQGCGQVGVIVYDTGNTDVMSVAHLVRAAHRGESQTGFCMYDPQVIVLENVHESTLFMKKRK